MREKRPPRPESEKVLSLTTLFVSNLPFSFDDAALADVFNGPGFVKAHVVRSRLGRSRGYGFVEYDSEDNQLKAKEAHQATSVGTEEAARVLNVSISTSLPREAEEGQQ